MSFLNLDDLTTRTSANSDQFSSFKIVDGDGAFLDNVSIHLCDVELLKSRLPEGMRLEAYRDGPVPAQWGPLFG